MGNSLLPWLMVTLEKCSAIRAATGCRFPSLKTDYYTDGRAAVKNKTRCNVHEHAAYPPLACTRVAHLLRYSDLLQLHISVQQDEARAW